MENSFLTVKPETFSKLFRILLHTWIIGIFQLLLHLIWAKTSTLGKKLQPL